MVDIVASIGKGKRLEDVAFASGSDTGQSVVVVTWSTTTFTTNESIVRALTEIIEIMEGRKYPPA